MALHRKKNRLGGDPFGGAEVLVDRRAEERGDGLRLPSQSLDAFGRGELGAGEGDEAVGPVVVHRGVVGAFVLEAVVDAVDVVVACSDDPAAAGGLEEEARWMAEVGGEELAGEVVDVARVGEDGRVDLLIRQEGAEAGLTLEAAFGREHGGSPRRLAGKFTALSVWVALASGLLESLSVSSMGLPEH